MIYINVEHFASRWAAGESFSKLAREAHLPVSTMRKKILRYIEEDCIKGDDEK